MRIDRPSVAEAPAIQSFLDRAFFPSRGESRLIEELRRAGRWMQERVTHDENGLAAYVALTKAYRGAALIGYHLAPLAVRPDIQRKGIGSRLVQAVLQERLFSRSSIFVLGAPDFYGRLGFAIVASPSCPFERERGHFQSLRWDCTDGFSIGYEPEFGLI